MSNKRAVVSYRQRMKMRLIEYKGGKCKLCGYDKKIPSAYGFHHRDPKEKDFGIAGKSLKFETLRREVDKCDLVCLRCHAEIHDAEYQEQRAANAAIYQKKLDSLLKDRACKKCGKVYQPDTRRRQYCSEQCSRLAHRKAERPSADELKGLVAMNSWCEIGRMFAVSDNAVRKWAKAYGIL